MFLNGQNMAIKMLREGWGVPVSFNEEPDFAAGYTNTALKAARDRIGVWDDDICGVGPAQNAVIDMVTNYDAAHDDSTNINGEYVQLRNRGTQTISFDGWQIRDSALRRFPLPNGVRLEPGGRLRIFVGRGTNTATSIFLNQDISIFGNEADGAFLYDSDFDIRAWDMWPCTETCELPEPLIIEEVNYDAPGDDNTNPNGEWIRIRNIGTTVVDLQDWMIEIPRAQLTSIASRPIPPGGAVTFYIGTGTNTNDKLYFGLPGGMLSNSNHLVTLYSPDRIVSSCDARGNRTCPPPINGGHPVPRQVRPGVTLRVPVTGVAGVPSSGVKGVALNLTAVNPSDRGWLRVWPCGSSEPGTASLKLSGGWCGAECDGDAGGWHWCGVCVVAGVDRCGRRSDGLVRRCGSAGVGACGRHA